MKLSTSTEWLFFHLWKKNPETGYSCPGVFIADTIVKFINFFFILNYFFRFIDGLNLIFGISQQTKG